ncbi:MAG: DUF5615 family PIN-like protein, partial [Bacteroidetes bacterium]|nr:DUF5615 family PIN-like protein [Bacteroidota bacterium]
MTFQFLVDVNLPKRFSFFNKPEFIHVVDIHPDMTDTEIWNYALNYKLVILTKNSDFYFRALTSNSSPRIVYFQIGNKTLKDLHLYFETYWKEITDKLLINSFLIALP